MMNEESPMEWAEKTAQFVRHSQETTFIDYIRGISYSLIQQEDIDEACQVVAESFAYANEFYKCQAITVEECKLGALSECQMAVADQLGFVARDIKSNKVVGVSLAYTYARAIQSAEEEDPVESSSENLAPIMDALVKLCYKLQEVESFDPSQAVMIDDIARIRDDRFVGKGIGYACFRILFAYIFRRGYTIALGTSLHHYTQQWGLLQGAKEACSIKLDEYTFRGQKVFTSLIEKGYDSFRLYFKRGE